MKGRIPFGDRVVEFDSGDIISGEMEYVDPGMDTIYFDDTLGSRAPTPPPRIVIEVSAVKVESRTKPPTLIEALREWWQTRKEWRQ